MTERGQRTVAREELNFPGTMVGLAQASEALRGFLDTCKLNAKQRYRIELTFDEIAGNIVRHGRIVTRINLQLVVDGKEVAMTFVDDGIAFNPREYPRPATMSVMSEELGGLGLPLVTAFASRIEYERTPDGRNRLTVTSPVA